MDHPYIDEQQVAERYLMGQLPPDEAALFEEHSLGCPDCLERLEVAETLRHGLRQVATEEVTGAVVAAQAGLLARLVRSRSAPWMVALLLLAAVLPSSLLLREVGRLDRELAEARRALEHRPEEPPSRPAGAPEAGIEALRKELAEQRRQAESERQESARLEAELAEALRPRINVPVVPLSPERSGPGGEPAARLTLGSSTEWVILSLQIDAPEDYPEYRATLLAPGDEVLWQASGLRPDAQGSLTVALPASQLAAGPLTVRVAGLPSGGRPAPVADFRFGLVRNP